MKTATPYYLIIDGDQVVGPYKTVELAKKGAKGYDPTCEMEIVQVIWHSIPAEISWKKT